MQVYLDAEFDAISIQGEYHQMIISIGAVMIDDTHHTCKHFYSLVKPYNFQRLSKVVKKITNLSDEDIFSAPSFQEVMGAFRDWIHIDECNLEKVKIYTFGPDDKRTLLLNAKFVSYDCEDLFGNIVDLQKELSSKIKYKGNIVSNTLSLDDLKNVYDIDGEVHHNALNDAIDLMHIHDVSKIGKINYIKVQMLVERKALKAEQVKEKERLHRLEEMRNRLTRFPQYVETRSIVPALKEQLNILNKRINIANIAYYREYILFENKKYTYQRLHIYVEVCVEKELYFFIKLKHSCFSWERKIEVTRYTISILENILKILIQTSDIKSKI